MSLHDPVEPDYGQILMKGDLATAVPNPEFLIVPDSGVLKLTVINIKVVFVHRSSP